MANKIIIIITFVLLTRIAGKSFQGRMAVNTSLLEPLEVNASRERYVCTAVDDFGRELESMED